MWVFWKVGGRKVFVYGLHKSALAAMNLLVAQSPALELKALDFGHETCVPVRELNFSVSDVLDLNKGAANDSR